MNDPRDLSIRDFHYDLPAERIARFPLEERDQSKLLVYRQGIIGETTFSVIADLLSSGDLLVFNKTRVIRARLLFQTASGAAVELFCIEPAKETTGLQQAMQQKGQAEWLCMVGRAKKWKPEEVLVLDIPGTPALRVAARLAGKAADLFRVVLSWDDETLGFAEMLERSGQVPLPPYLKRKAETTDSTRYQTVYAGEDGSVAAPTAGLHFSPTLLRQLEKKGIETVYLTLHVGAGTFKPVKAPRMGEHEMHREEIGVSRETLEKLGNTKGRIIAVGTTTLRSLESICLTGLKEPADKDSIRIAVDQWEGYSNRKQAADARAVYRRLAEQMEQRKQELLTGFTRILIGPGYPVQAANALVTNFHQPESTLLLLVSAFVGESWREIYTYALEHDFRFLSYGDSSILFREFPADTADQRRKIVSA